MRFTIAILLIIISSLVIAEVPGHNPDLDSQCSQGKQYSRGTADCKQANCPPGAGRTYTYDFSCWVSEWCVDPKVTCYENGLAVRCLPKGGDCNKAKSGFDPITGNCKQGYDLNADKTDCVAKFPDKVSCKVIDLDGNPIKNGKILYGEYTKSETAHDSSKTGNTNDNGEIEFQVTNTHSKSVNFIFTGGDGYYKSATRIYADGQKECKITAYKNDQIGPQIKGKFIDLLKNACMPQDLINKINDAKFNFDSDVDTSQYDGKEIKIAKGELGGDWETLERTLVHEFGHYLSEKLIDADKSVGGKHNNWEPNEDKSWWQFTKSDPEELAFEEGLADFMAMLYFQAKEEVYQEDYATNTHAINFLSSNGKDKGGKTEGVVTSFLYEYYKNQLKEEKGAARAFGDLVRSATYEPRKNSGTPARTIKDFIIQKIRTDKNEQSNECSPKSQMPNIADLSRKYGFESDEKYKLTVDSLTKVEANDVEILSPPPDALSPGFFLEKLIPYELRTNTQAPALISYPSDYATSGIERRITFKPGTASFEIGQDNVVLIKNGSAFVIDADVRTHLIKINHKQTKYLVEVSGDRESVTVLDGSADVSDANAQVSLNSGENVDYTAGKFSDVKKVDINAVKPFWKRSNAEQDGNTGKTGGGTNCLSGIISTALLGITILRNLNKKD